MKDEANSLLEEETEEVRTWRGLNQEEMDQCWKSLAERMVMKFWTSTRSRTAKERLTEAGAPRWNGGVYEEAKNLDKKVERILLGNNLRFVQRIQAAASANHA